MVCVALDRSLELQQSVSVADDFFAELTELEVIALDALEPDPGYWLDFGLLQMMPS